MAEISGLLIDPNTQSVTEVKLDSALEGIRDQIFHSPEEGNLVTVALFEYYELELGQTITCDIWCDDEGLLKPNKVTKLKDHQQEGFAGRLLLLCSDEDGECVSLPEEYVPYLKEQVQWTHLELR